MRRSGHVNNLPLYAIGWYSVFVSWITGQRESYNSMISIKDAVEYSLDIYLESIEQSDLT